MFDKLRLKDALDAYKKNFAPSWWADEKYKWEAVKCFQDNWDVNATDFADMLARSLKKTKNLLTSSNYFPKKMIQIFAKKTPEKVRTMFIKLFDESNDVVTRIIDFKEQSSKLLESYGNGADNHYQYINSISTYLWLRYPDKYYIYKYSEINAVAKNLGSDIRFKKGDYNESIRNFYSFYDEICNEIKKDNELIELFKSQITDTCYPDKEYKTLTIDVGFYISRYYSSKDQPNGYWWINANPKIWSFSEIDVGEVRFYTFYNDDGNKRRIFQNFMDAKEGDMFIGYDCYPVKKIVTIGRISEKQEEEKLFFEKVEDLKSPIDFEKLKSFPELENMEYFVNPKGSLFKLTKDEYDLIIDIIREENTEEPFLDEVDGYSKEDFLNEVYMNEESYNKLVLLLRNKKNIILQGAPGVGKTFIANRLAYSMMGEKDESRVEFVQFHQNYSYEDFMMGYKPKNDGFELREGIFYRFCQKAAENPEKEHFFIIDEINRGNMSKIFGELLFLIERDYRGEKATLAYNGLSFTVPENIYIIGMMNTADRSLAMIDYALRRRFSFFDIKPGFESDGFKNYENQLNDETFSKIVSQVQKLNEEIKNDKSLGEGFSIGHSYFCNQSECTEDWMLSIVEYDILPMLREYWFDDTEKIERWEGNLKGVF